MIAELGRARADHLPYDLPRYTQLPADRLNCLPLYKERPAYLRDCLHDQHPLAPTESWKPMWTPLSGVPIGCRSPPKGGPSCMLIHSAGRRVHLPGLLVRADVFAENRKSLPRLPAIEAKHQAHGGDYPRAHYPIADVAGNHRAGGRVESHVARMGELLPRRKRDQSVPGDRQLHRCAVAPVVALQAQGQTTQGRDLSTLAPLRALRARTPDRAWARRAVGEGVKSCPRAGCGKPACPVR